MCNWKRWVWPGILATVILTALSMFFQSGKIENDLTAKASSVLQAANPWASVALDGRDLTLNGVAPSEEAAAAALLSADNAYDVRVARNATTLPPMASPYPFKAIKNNDGITLTGNYPSDAVRAEIVAAAGSAMPGIAIKDELTLARGAPAGFAALAGLGLSQLGNFTDGEAALSDIQYTIKGTAADPAAYEAETARATGTLPEGGALAMADITPPTIAPYVWNAAKAADNTITLTGYAPSIDARDAVAAAAVVANPGVTVVNQLQIGAGAPASYGDMTAFGLGQLNGLSTGTAALADDNYAITGAAKTSAAYDAERNSANGQLPGGKLANVAITPPVAEGSYTWAATKGPDGSITLTGLMPTTEDRDRIAARAAAINPGAAITNQIQIASGAPNGFVDAADYSLGYLPRFTAGTVNMSNLDLNVQGRAADAANFDAAKAINGQIPAGVQLAENITLPQATGTYEVVATRSATVITLQGFAPSTAAKDKIVAEANGFGLPVVDRIVVAAGAPDGFDWGSAAASVVKGLQRASAGTATLRGNVASVDADLATNAIGSAQASAVFSASMVQGVKAETVAYRLPRVTPYNWLATRDASVAISGYVPSRELGDKVATEAKAFFPGADISNKQALASGEPRGLESAISIGLASISRLESARAEIVDNVLTVSGVAQTQPAKTDIERKVVNGVPPGFTGIANITVKPAPLAAGGLGQLAPNLCQLQINNVLKGGINFETDKADISQTSYGVLDQLAYTAGQCPDAKIVIGGHTDSDGADAYNQRLSEARATEVLKYLVTSGIASARLAAVGFGETSPIATNDTEEGKAQNRRIEFVIAQ
ncbi:MAG: OmpA family protein [Ahrensia sp.]|nr:OmpA family protein [Ahrensia sp.]